MHERNSLPVVATANDHDVLHLIQILQDCHQEGLIIPSSLQHSVCAGESRARWQLGIPFPLPLAVRGLMCLPVSVSQ